MIGLQSLATATPAPGTSIIPVTERRQLLQDQPSGVQVQVLVMGPATNAQQIAAALATAVDSGEFTTSLQLAGQAGLCV